MFLEKGVLKNCSRFAGEHPCRSAISTKLKSNHIEISLRHGCFPETLLYIFRALFTKTTSRRLLLYTALVFSWLTSNNWMLTRGFKDLRSVVWWISQIISFSRSFLTRNFLNVIKYLILCRKYIYCKPLKEWKVTNIIFKRNFDLFNRDWNKSKVWKIWRWCFWYCTRLR